MRPAAPQVPLVAVRVGFLPAPGRRREHRAEHAQVDLPEPGPLLEAARNVAVFRDILSRVIDADTDGSLARARASRDPFPGLRLTTHPSH